jgi:hypothetical protein
VSVDKSGHPFLWVIRATDSNEEHDSNHRLLLICLLCLLRSSGSEAAKRRNLHTHRRTARLWPESTFDGMG